MAGVGDHYWDDGAYVCVDCYAAHAYGFGKHGGEWFAGENDYPCEHEPLRFLKGCELADWCDTESGEGYETFSWYDCHGCGSHKGGERFRLAYKVREDEGR